MPDNVATARRLYELEAERDNAAIFALYHPAIEWDMSHYPQWLEGSLYHGHEGVRAFMSAWLRSFDSWEAEIEDAVAAGDRVLLVIRDRATFRGGTALVRRRYGHLFTFRDGLVVRSEIYQDLDEAQRSLAG